MKNRSIFKFKDSIPAEHFDSILVFVNSQMEKIEYGMFDENGNEITDPDRYYEDTRIQEAEWVLKNKRGNCVDQTNLEYWFFKENQIKTNIYYVEYTTEERITPSHMFIVLENQKKFFWFENAWKAHQGIKQYDSLLECLNDIKYAFCPYDYLDTFKVYEVEELVEGSNPNKELKRKEIKMSGKPNLYYLSKNELSDLELTPSIPNDYLTEYGYSDIYQERVALFPSIEQALCNEKGNLRNFDYFVYVPDCEIDCYRPTVDEIPTVLITGETWSYLPVKVKKMGKIKVGSSIPNGNMAYSYGNGLTDYLQKWNYEITDGNLIKDNWKKIQSIQELQKILKNKHPDWSSDRIYTAAYKMHQKQLNEQKNKSVTKPNLAVNYVIDIYGDKKFKGTEISCQEYLKDNPNEKLVYVDEESLKKMDYNDIKSLFEDSKPTGIHIEFGDSTEFEGCIDVNVIDYDNSSNILDQEVCYNMKEVRYVIVSYKQQYKIKKVEKRGNKQ